VAATLEPNVDWKLTVDSEDLRLILTALRGGLTEEQHEPAMKLQARLTVERAKVLKNLSDSATRVQTQVETRPLAFGERPREVAKVGGK
jgi:hypothetical protein